MAMFKSLGVNGGVASYGKAAFILYGVLIVYLCSMLVVNGLCKNWFHSFSSFFHSFSTPVPVFFVTFSPLFPAFGGVRDGKDYKDKRVSVYTYGWLQRGGFASFVEGQRLYIGR